MTAPLTTAPPWTSSMLDSTVFTRTPRTKAGYAIDEVDAFKDRAVARARFLEGEVGRLTDERDKSREALRLRADSEGPFSPPTLAVTAVSGGQEQGEDELGKARVEARRILLAARQQAAEAEEYLRRARQTAAEAPVRVELPPEPALADFRDPVAYMDARSRWIEDCQEILDERQHALAAGGAALNATRQGFVTLLDQLEARSADMRARVIPLPPTEAIEDVAS